MTQKKFPTGSIGERYGTIGTTNLTLGEIVALGLSVAGPVKKTQDHFNALTELKKKDDGRN